MSSLISDADKASLVADFQQVVDTFVRPFIIFQEATHTVVITDPNWNPLTYSNNQNNTDVTNTPNFTTVMGRVLYDKDQESSFVRPYGRAGGDEGQLKIKDQTVRSVRLKLDPAGNELMKTAKKVSLDGVQFDVESKPRPHGLFVPNYYTFYLVRSS